MNVAMKIVVEDDEEEKGHKRNHGPDQQDVALKKKKEDESQRRESWTRQDSRNLPGAGLSSIFFQVSVSLCDWSREQNPL